MSLEKISIQEKQMVKIFTVTKNEYDLIQDFIYFYGTLFGYENLIIIDTGSEDTSVLDYYDKIKKEKNVNIIFENGYEGSKQGDYFTKYMLIEKSKKSCEFLLGLDTDNFLILSNGQNINRDEYLKYFKSLSYDQNKFLIHNTYDSVVNKTDCSYINNKYNYPASNCKYFTKGRSVYINFYRCDNFIKTSNGNHLGTTEPDQTPLMTEFTCIHYNYTGIKRYQERCINIVVNYKYICLMQNQNYENAKINYKNMCNLIKNKNYGNGIHRVIGVFSFVLRDFVYEIFKRYADNIFCNNLNYYYKIIYSNKNILDNIDEYDEKKELCNNFYDEYNLATYGNVSFCEYKILYDVDQIEKDFESFFRNKNKCNITFSKEEIYNNDELDINKYNLNYLNYDGLINFIRN